MPTKPFFDLSSFLLNARLWIDSALVHKLPATTYTNGQQLTQTNKCWCGEQATEMHMASGCKLLKNAYIDRHHKAGQCILKSIAAGDLGDQILYADIGSDTNLSLAGIPETIRVKVRTRSLKLPPNSSRPDIILGARPPPPISRTQGEPLYTKLTLVELKYARDTDTAAQLQKARTQHYQLANYLAKLHNCEVKILPIILGVSGSVYPQHTLQPLQEIGIRGQALKAVIRKLHLHAIRALAQLYTMNRQHNKRRRMRNRQTMANVGNLDPGG